VPDTICAACGEPVSYTDEGGCVGTDPAYHFKAECLLEAARRADFELQQAVEALELVTRERRVNARGQIEPRPSLAAEIAITALAALKERYPVPVQVATAEAT
jgi:hypothetical protein